MGFFDAAGRLQLRVQFLPCTDPSLDYLAVQLPALTNDGCTGCDAFQFFEFIFERVDTCTWTLCSPGPGAAVPACSHPLALDAELYWDSTAKKMVLIASLGVECIYESDTCTGEYTLVSPDSSYELPCVPPSSLNVAVASSYDCVTYPETPTCDCLDSMPDNLVLTFSTGNGGPWTAPLTFDGISWKGTFDTGPGTGCTGDFPATVSLICLGTLWELYINSGGDELAFVSGGPKYTFSCSPLVLEWTCDVGNNTCSTGFFSCIEPGLEFPVAAIVTAA